MWRPKFEFFSEINLETSCELLCPNCPVWQNNGTPLALEKIKPRAKAVHLCGGNPLAYPDLPQLLVQLKQKKHFVALTTCGYRLANLAPQLLLLTDLILLYLPGYTKEKSLQRTGFNALDRQFGAIEYLQELKKKFIVLYPADSETIEELPDLQNKLRQKNSYLILLYDKKSEYPIPRQERAYLRYYAQRANTLLYVYRNGRPPNCRDFTTNLKRFTLPNLFFWLKLFLKLYFFN